MADYNNNDGDDSTAANPVGHENGNGNDDTTPSKHVAFAPAEPQVNGHTEEEGSQPPVPSSAAPTNDSLHRVFGLHDANDRDASSAIITDQHKMAEPTPALSHNEDPVSCPSLMQEAPDSQEFISASARAMDSNPSSSPQLARTSTTGDAVSKPAPASTDAVTADGGDLTPAASAPMFPGGLSNTRRARKSFKLSEAPMGPRHTALDSLFSDSTASPTRAIVCPAMQVRPSSVSEVASKVARRPANVRAALPDPLPVPVEHRCDFCIKFDSVCFHCHFKWKNTLLKARVAKLMETVKAQSEASRVIVFFSAVARGNADFVKAFLDVYPDCLHWSTHFYRMHPNDTALHPDIDEAGRVFPLHVAMAANRPEIARELISRGAPFRRSDKNVLPLDLIHHGVSTAAAATSDGTAADGTPADGSTSSSAAAWEEHLGDLAPYKVHVLSERSKALRAEAKYEEAATLYEEALKIMPTSEQALCGLAKMAFDAGNFDECVRRCDAILADPSKVAWGQFGPSTIELLRKHSVDKHHEVAHPKRGSVLRSCGCVILDHVVIRLRRLPFKLFRLHVLPFVDCLDSVRLYTAMRRMPLMTRVLAGHASTLSPDEIFKWLMSEKETSERLIVELRRSVPEPDYKVTEPPATFRGCRVFAVADFNAIVLTAFAEIGNAKYKKEKSVWSFGKKKEEPKTLWFAKQFQLIRNRLDDPWTVSSAGEWESIAPPHPVIHGSKSETPANSATGSRIASSASSPAKQT